ncbi:hypothetical protein SteCoe_1888 [Stentor coeruleus]|uniref:Peptidase C51 domain-containing protein n=1 Tax=Stentor coeruleus TaxID=5963 RepID=A0A1R2D0U9_9CILI|nr:hypothetical protein SteCoe_1888 [Stentor coeruleus]
MQEDEEYNREDFVTPFARVLGSYQGVDGKSNGSDRHFSGIQNFVNDLYTGYKYQCVEYARRWLLSKGLEFYSVPLAAHIWHIRFLERYSDGKATPINPVSNGSTSPPVPDSILIWKIAEDVPCGHIAVVTEVNLSENYIRIAEQNMKNDYWPGNYARQIPLENVDGHYWIRDEDELYGWMIIDFDVDHVDQQALDKINHPVKKHTKEVTHDNPWLDLNDPIEAYYYEKTGKFMNSGTFNYFTIEEHLAYKVLYATMECSFMLNRATNKVVNSPELMEKFGLPQWTWDMIKDSWNFYWNSKGKTITGRLEFAFKGRNVKLVDFYGDTLYGLAEAVKIQDKLAGHLDCTMGDSPSVKLKEGLITHVKSCFKDFVHICTDSKQEHLSIAHFIQNIIRECGLDSKILVDLDFSKDTEGNFYDQQGVQIKSIWKIWDWETVLADYENPRQENEVKISDLLLSKNVFVLEPLWKLVTSNRALKAVMNEINPNHGYLLDAKWDLPLDTQGKNYLPLQCGYKKLSSSQEHTIYVEEFLSEEFEGIKPIICSWPVARYLTGFSLDTKSFDDQNDRQLVCCRIIGD